MTNNSIDSNVNHASQVYQAASTAQVTKDDIKQAKLIDSGSIEIKGKTYTVTRIDGNSSAEKPKALAKLALELLKLANEDFNLNEVKVTTLRHGTLIFVGPDKTASSELKEINEGALRRGMMTIRGAEEGEGADEAAFDGLTDGMSTFKAKREPEAIMDGTATIKGGHKVEYEDISDLEPLPDPRMNESEVIMDGTATVKRNMKPEVLAERLSGNYDKIFDILKPPETLGSIQKEAVATDSAVKEAKLFNAPHITAQPRTEIQYLMAKRVILAAAVLLTSPILLPALALTATYAGSQKLYLKGKDFLQVNSLLAKKNDVKAHEKETKLKYLETAGLRRADDAQVKDVLQRLISVDQVSTAAFGEKAEFQDSLTKTLEAIPFEKIVENPSDTLVEVNKLLKANGSSDIAPDLWQNMLNTAQSTTVLSTLVTAENIGDRLNNRPLLEQKKVLHHTLNYLATRPDVDIDSKVGSDGKSIKEIVRDFSVTYTTSAEDPEEFLTHLNQELLKAHDISISPEAWDTITAEIDKEFPKSTIAGFSPAATFTNKLNDFQNILKDTTLTPKDKNKAIVQAFRDILSTEAYQAMKQDSSNPLINFIHSYASGLWNEVQVMDMYKGFGEAVVQRDPILQGELIEAADGNKRFGEVLERGIGTSTKTLSKRLFTDHGVMGKVAYIIAHPRQILGAMASEGGKLREFAALFGSVEYDPHGRLTNVPSLQGYTQATFDGKAARINNVYGGTPTMSDTEISPEYLAVLQAAENNRLAPSDNERIAGVPDYVLYANFQNIEGENEGKRSATIMRLNQSHPLAFQGITLSKDSKFYRMLEGPISWERSVVDDKPYTAAQSMGREMRSVLMDPKNFTLDKKRIGDKDGPGCYFPGEPARWEKIFDVVLEHTNEVFAEIVNLSGSREEAFELRGAYQEYVYASVQDYVEMETAYELTKSGIKDPLIQAQRACKENIDRGGAANAAYLHLRLDDTNPEKAGLVLGALHSRALGARDRMILEARLPQIRGLIKHVDSQKFREQQAAMFQKVGFTKESDKAAFTPSKSSGPLPERSQPKVQVQAMERPYTGPMPESGITGAA